MKYKLTIPNKSKLLSQLRDEAEEIGVVNIWAIGDEWFLKEIIRSFDEYMEIFTSPDKINNDNAETDFSYFEGYEFDEPQLVNFSIGIDHLIYRKLIIIEEDK